MIDYGVDVYANTVENAMSDQLMKVIDFSNSPQGFKDDSNGIVDNENDYTYDANGNLTSDQNKGITNITYNHLNLPTEVEFGVTGKIEYLYNATGQKIQKNVVDPSTTPIVTDYMNGGFQYTNNVLSFFPHAEGYVNVTLGKRGSLVFNYVYQYKDHLGNNRLNFSLDPLGVSTTEQPNPLKIIEENHYYPFGLKHTSYNTNQYAFVEVENGNDYYMNVSQLPAGGVSNYKYKYNGKELEDELGKNTYAYGWRDYDPAIGRFNKMDRFSEKYYDKTPYNYAGNNPVYFIDVAGDSIHVDSRKAFNELKNNVKTKIDSYTAEKNAITAAATNKKGTVKYTNEQQAQVNELNSKIGSLTGAQTSLTKMENSSKFTFKLNAVSGNVAEILPTASDVNSNTYTLNYLSGDIGNQVHEVAVHGGQIVNGDILFSVDASNNVTTSIKSGLSNINLEVTAYQAQYSYMNALSGYKTPGAGSNEATINNLSKSNGTNNQVNQRFSISAYNQIDSTLVKSMQKSSLGHNPQY